MFFDDERGATLLSKTLHDFFTFLDESLKEELTTFFCVSFTLVRERKQSGSLQKGSEGVSISGLGPKRILKKLAYTNYTKLLKKD